MVSDRWREVSRIFREVAALDRERQPAALEDLCGTDEQMRAEVESLLDNDSPSFMAGAGHLRGLGPATDAAGSSPGEDPSLATDIGPYRLREILGQGGMGQVFLAQQTSPVLRDVALKVVPRGVNANLLEERLESERQVLAVLKHPNIAQMYDGGLTEQGTPYFVMEYVDGVPITEYCNEQQLNLEQRLDLFYQVCSGLHHAHQKAIIHRDIKPTNILVTTINGQPTPKVIDFGIAKILEESEVPPVHKTEHGVLLGTPEYMSPEQARFDALSVDIRSDVYSLGVVLYELLVGALPIDSETLRKGGVMELQQVLETVEPAKPSDRLASKSSGTEKPVTTVLARDLRGDLDWITLRALEKSPERRYGSASDLAADVYRYLRDEPVEARPPTRSYRLRKLVKRNRVTFVLLTLLLCSAFVTAGVSFGFGLYRAEQYQKILRFSDLQRIVTIERLLDEFAPPHPTREGETRALHQWARQLAGRLPHHEAVLSSLKSGEGLQGIAPLDENFPENWVGAMDGESDERWQVETQQLLVERLREFASTDPYSALSRSERLLHHAENIESWSLTNAEAAREWQVAVEEIRTLEVYDGLILTPRLGLVPLRRDPHSGLWEFWHVLSGEKPESETDPSRENPWRLTKDTGMVFVLIPGGTDFVGAQSVDPARPNFTEIEYTDAKREFPEHLVEVDPFFISKYEVTQGQWMGATGSNPSRDSSDGRVRYLDQERPLLHPVENVGHDEAVQVLRQLGLQLPTEQQWEFAARAGVDDPWWTGASVETLQGVENIADRTYANASRDPSRVTHERALDDGYAAHAPVGSFRASPFGLFDVHGNVTEWTRSRFAGYGERAGSSRSDLWVYRGGSYKQIGRQTTSASRSQTEAPGQSPEIGVRPVVALDEREEQRRK